MLHNQRARRCTGSVIPTKQRSFAEIGRCAVTARGVARGKPAALHGSMPCNACIENVQTLYVCRWRFPALSLLHMQGGTADPLQDLNAQIDQMMIGGKRSNLSNETAMLRGLAQLFVHIPQINAHACSQKSYSKNGV